MSDLSIFKFCVEDDGISTVIGPLLELKSLFTLSVCNKKLNKNYRPFIALLLQKENAASRLARVCLREKRRRQKWNPSNPEPLGIYVNFPHWFQYLNFSSLCQISTKLYRLDGSKTVPYTPEIHIRIANDEPIIFVTVWTGLHLAKHARFIEIEPGVEIPAYKGEGDDPLIRKLERHPWCVVLNLNGRQWVGQSLCKSFRFDAVFMFHLNPKGDAHALLLASDLIQYTCVFAPHLELGIDGMA
jgi:hypothetical protein